MGLDWTLLPKPKEGHEKEFDELVRRIRNGEDVSERLREISYSPLDTLGCPRIGIDEVATKYFVEVLIPHYREVTDDDHWKKPLEELVEEHRGEYVPDLIDYDKSTFTAFGPFRSLAGYCSFRGKAVAYNKLLPKDLRDEAYTSMSPDQMRDYASRIEKAALNTFKELHPEVEDPREELKVKFQEYLNQKKKLLVEYEEISENVSDEDVWGVPVFLSEHSEEIEKKLAWFDDWMLLKIVLDAAEWLRFWADKGHAMEPWY